MGYLAGALLAAVRLPGSRRAWLIGALARERGGARGDGRWPTRCWRFLVLRFIAGVASAFGLIFASALVLDRLAAAGRGRLSAVHFAGVGIGIAVSAALVALLHDWRTMWFASAALAPRRRRRGDRRWCRPIVPARRSRPAAARALAAAASSPLAIAYGLFGFGYIITATFIVAMVRGTPAIASLEPYIWVMFGLGAAPSVALWTALGRALGHPPHLRRSPPSSRRRASRVGAVADLGDGDRGLGVRRRHLHGPDRARPDRRARGRAAIRAAASPW